eukprot:jgi/Ulvmu1/5854/UM025_0116.1
MAGMHIVVKRCRIVDKHHFALLHVGVPSRSCRAGDTYDFTRATKQQCDIDLYIRAASNSISHIRGCAQTDPSEPRAHVRETATTMQVLFAAFTLLIMSTAHVAMADMSTDDCVPLGEAAADAGLTSLVEAIKIATPALQTSESGVSFLAAVSGTEPQEGSKQLTVCAPTNVAFDAIMADLGADATPEALADVLLNHAVEGALPANAIMAALSDGGGEVEIETLLGDPLLVTQGATGDIFLQSQGIPFPGAAVVMPNVFTCAGPVHVVDAVLAPNTAEGAIVPLGSTLPGGGPAPGPAALGPMLAPGVVDEALDLLAPGVVFDGPDMAPGPVEFMFPGPVEGPMDMPSDMPIDMPINTPAVAPDVVVAPVPMGACISLAATAADAGLTSLLGATAIAAPALEESAEGRAVLDAVALTEPVPALERVTVFAPSDDAFTAAAAAFGGDVPGTDVSNTLLNHVVSGDLTAAAILQLVNEGGGSAQVVTLSGGPLLFTVTGGALYVQSAGLEAPGALVVTPDVITCAGPAHVVDAVLLPALPDGSQADLGGGGGEEGMPPSDTREFEVPPDDGVGGPAAVNGGAEIGNEPGIAVVSDTDAAPRAQVGAAVWVGVASALTSVVALAA